MTIEATEICLLWGDLQIQKWWSCMTKAEWSGWMQAGGVLLTMISMAVGYYLSKKKYREEIRRKKIADSVSIKYYLRQHRNFTSAIEPFIYAHEWTYSDYKNNIQANNKGKIIESSIECFSMTEEFFNQILQSIDDLRFNERSDLHLNSYAGALEDIIGACNSLRYLFERYANQKENINRLFAERNEIDDGNYQEYWSKLVNYHSEWQTYANASYQYFKKIADNWAEIMNGVSSINRNAL